MQIIFSIQLLLLVLSNLLIFSQCMYVHYTFYARHGYTNCGAADNYFQLNPTKQLLRSSAIQFIYK